MLTLIHLFRHEFILVQFIVLLRNYLVIVKSSIYYLLHVKHRTKEQTSIYLK